MAAATLAKKSDSVNIENEPFRLVPSKLGLRYIWKTNIKML